MNDVITGTEFLQITAHNAVVDGFSGGGGDGGIGGSVGKGGGGGIILIFVEFLYVRHGEVVRLKPTKNVIVEWGDLL